MDVMDAIQKRRSIRHFKPDDIPNDVLERLLNAMRLAPSGENRQPWKFIVVRDKTTKYKVAATCIWKTSDGKQVLQKWINEAPVIIVACGFEKEASVRYYKKGELIITDWASLEAEMQQTTIEYESSLVSDLTIAIDHLTLAARAEGLGTCWLGSMKEPQVKEILSIPKDVRAPLAVVLGYPMSWPNSRPRKSINEIICYDKYSN